MSKWATEQPIFSILNDEQRVATRWGWFAPSRLLYTPFLLLVVFTYFLCALFGLVSSKSSPCVFEGGKKFSPHRNPSIRIFFDLRASKPQKSPSVNSTSKNWLARLVGNEGPSTFTAWYVGDETSLIPYESGQLEKSNLTCFGIPAPIHPNLTPSHPSFRVVPTPDTTRFQANQYRITVVDVTAVPRITIAQKLDVLSSQAKVAGHRAVLEALDLGVLDGRGWGVGVGGCGWGWIFFLGGGWGWIFFLAQYLLVINGGQVI